MKLIPEEVRCARKCYFCGGFHTKENPVAFELDVDETTIPKSEAKFLGGSVYCCKKCLEKEWMAT